MRLMILSAREKNWAFICTFTPVSYTHLVIGGRISTGNYKDKDGKTVYTTDVIVEEHEFAQNKESNPSSEREKETGTSPDGFMNVPDDDEIPFQ